MTTCYAEEASTKNLIHNPQVVRQVVIISQKGVQREFADNQVRFSHFPHLQSNKPSVLTQSLCAGRNTHHHLGSIVAKKNNGIVGEKSSGCTPLPSLAIFLFGGVYVLRGRYTCYHGVLYRSLGSQQTIQRFQLQLFFL